MPVSADGQSAKETLKALRLIREKLGLKTVNGLDMLIYQGAKALEIWTDKKPDTQTMKIAALEAL